MNLSQVGSLARMGLTAAATYCVTKGLLKPEDATPLVDNLLIWGGLTVQIVPIVWGMIRHKKG